MQRQVQRLAGVIRGGNGEPYAGRDLFRESCAACHVLLGQGGQLGPDLTSYKRDDIAKLLANIVNPSAEIREGYEYNLIQTSDGRSLSGFLAEKNDQFVVLRGLDAQNVAIDRKAVVKIEPAGRRPSTRPGNVPALGNTSPLVAKKSPPEILRGA